MTWMENFGVKLIDFGFSALVSIVLIFRRASKSCLWFPLRVVTSVFKLLTWPLSPTTSSDVVEMGLINSTCKTDDSEGIHNRSEEPFRISENHDKKFFDLDFNGNFKRRRSSITINPWKRVKDTDVITIPWDLATKKIDPALIKGLEKGSRVFWVKADIAEPGLIKWVGRIKGALFAGLQLDKKIAVTVEGYSGKSLFTCKNRRGRALVLLSQVVPEHEFIRRDKSHRRSVAFTMARVAEQSYVKCVPSPTPSADSDDSIQAKLTAEYNSYALYEELQPEGWDRGDRIYFPSKKAFANIIARGSGAKSGEFVIEYDKRIGDPTLVPTSDVWFKEGHGRIMSLRKLVANAMIVEPNFNGNASAAPKPSSLPQECNNNTNEQNHAWSLNNRFFQNPRHSGKRLHDDSLSLEPQAVKSSKKISYNDDSISSDVHSWEFLPENPKKFIATEVNAYGILPTPPENRRNSSESFIPEAEHHETSRKSTQATYSANKRQQNFYWGEGSPSTFYTPEFKRSVYSRNIYGIPSSPKPNKQREGSNRFDQGTHKSPVYWGESVRVGGKGIRSLYEENWDHLRKNPVLNPVALSAEAERFHGNYLGAVETELLRAWYEEDNRADYMSTDELPGAIKEDKINLIRGVEGELETSFMDSAIMSLFCCTNIFDSLLQLNPKDRDFVRELKLYLRNGIVRKLRTKFFLQWEAIIGLRNKMACFRSAIETCTMDVGDFLCVLFTALEVPHFIYYRTVKLSDYIHLIHYPARPCTATPATATVQSLFDSSMESQELTIEGIPKPGLIIQMPGLNGKFEGFDYVVPSLQLDLCKVYQHSEANLCICEKPVQVKCSLCKSPRKGFCSDCVWQAGESHLKLGHRFAATATLRQSVPGVLDLVGVICCSSTNHYTTYVKCGTSLMAPWLFFDSQCSEVREFPTLGQGLLRLERQSNEVSFKFPPHLKHILTNCHICIYSSL